MYYADYIEYGGGTPAIDGATRPCQHNVIMAMTDGPGPPYPTGTASPDPGPQASEAPNMDFDNP